MITDFRSILPTATLREVVELLLTGSQHDFPMINEHGDLIGMVARQRLISALTEHGPLHSAESILTKCELQVTARMDLAEALTALDGSSCPALPVIDPITGHLIGLLTSENVGELLMVRTALRPR